MDQVMTYRWYSMYRVKQCLVWFVVGNRKSAGAVSSCSIYKIEKQDEQEIWGGSANDTQTANW